MCWTSGFIRWNWKCWYKLTCSYKACLVSFWVLSQCFLVFWCDKKIKKRKENKTIKNKIKSHWYAFGLHSLMVPWEVDMWGGRGWGGGDLSIVEFQSKGCRHDPLLPYFSGKILPVVWIHIEKILWWRCMQNKPSLTGVCVFVHVWMCMCVCVNLCVCMWCVQSEDSSSGKISMSTSGNKRQLPSAPVVMQDITPSKTGLLLWPGKGLTHYCCHICMRARGMYWWCYRLPQSAQHYLCMHAECSCSW